MRRARILATGFGPFPGVRENRSAWLMRRLAAAWPRLFADGAAILKTAVIPTEWRLADRIAAREAARFRPDAIVHFGVASSRERIEIETFAQNVCDGRSDCAGRARRPGRIACGGAGLAATLSAQRIVRALRSAGLAAAASDDAGQYLCNFLLYATLRREAAARSPAIAGFIHVPAAGDPARLGRDARGDALMRGARAILCAAARQAGHARRRPAKERSGR